MLLFLFTFSVFASLVPPGHRINQEQLSREVPQNFIAIEKSIIHLFKSEVNAQGGEIIVEHLLDDLNVGASAARSGRRWFIKVKAGMIFHRLVDDEIYAAVFCHELGHHLGGAPFKFPKVRRKDWVSVEGQADYFTTNICLKRYYATQDNETILKTQSIPSFLEKNCAEKTQGENYYICLRNALVAQKLGNFLARGFTSRRGNRAKKPNLLRPSRTHVRKTLIEHPEPQCRLDTFYQGSLCHQSLGGNELLNCPDTYTFNSGARPLCWYVPDISSEVSNQ